LGYFRSQKANSYHFIIHFIISFSFSEFIVDMKAPGITIRPIINIVGKHSFNEVFFDDVKIHKKYLVGEENGGFKQIMAQMDY